MNKIQQAFSRSANDYDHYSGLHRNIADRLLRQVLKEPVLPALLDVGCGTGYLTGKAKEFFPQSKIAGLDFAEGMIDRARSKHADIEWVLGDGHNLPFADETFDGVISNLAYQWSEDLTQSFREARRVLRPQGVLACTLFGYHTCQELFQALIEAKGKELQFSRLANEEQMRDALRLSGFKDVKVESEDLKKEFKDMYELMTWLKSIGANNLSREGFLGAEAITKAASIYREKFMYQQGVLATFEVIWVYGRK